MDNIDDNFLNENLLPKNSKVKFIEEEKEKEKGNTPNYAQRKSRRTIRILEKELTFKEKREIVFRTVKDSFTYIMTVVPHLLLITISLMFLGHNDNTLIQVNSVQLGMALINVIGLDLAIGSMSAFDLMGGKAFSKDKSALLKIYHEARIFCLLIFLLFILPFGYSGDYILYFLGMNEEISETAGSFIKISLMSILFSMNNQLNVRILYLDKKETEVLFTNVFILALHTILCMIFITTFSLGAFGAAVSLVISNLICFLITSYLISSNNPFNGESFFMIDTNSLSSSKFYYYAVLGSKIGFFSALRHLPRNFIILGSIYLNWVDFSVNCLLHNYISIFFYFIVGFGISLSKSIVNTFAESSNLRKFYIYVHIVNGIVLCSLISILNYFLENLTCFIYIGEDFHVNGVSFIQEMRDKFSHILSLYCIFIFFEWINNSSMAVLKAINKYKSTNLITSGIQVTIFVPLAMLLSYTYGFGYAGMWYSMFSSNFIFSIINFNYLLETDMRKACEAAFKERLEYKREDDEVD